jgi:outer membrane protein assembly factor BamB
MTMRLATRTLALLLLVGAPAAGVAWNRAVGDSTTGAAIANLPTQNWSMWCGSATRNNVATGVNIPTEWEVGDFDFRTGAWDPTNAKNIKWVSPLGSRSYGSAVVHDGKVFTGSNNTAGHLKRFPPEVDLGCLLCFDIKDGKFLRQHSSTKLPSGRVHDWPHEGVCSVPYCEGDRIWFVTNRCEVRCLDINGFLDGENDGEIINEQADIEAQVQALEKATGKKIPIDYKQEADVIWSVDMMKDLGVSPHNMSSCSITGAGDVIFVCTSNGIDEEHKFVPSPDAPSFLAMNKNTGEVLWSDNSPGKNIHHGQWSSPAYAEIGGQAQVIFGGGDGWVYSFDPKGDGNGKAKLLWKFDTNPKTAKLELMGKGTRNDCIGTPVIYEDLVYVATGQDPEHGEGLGYLWCIDPMKKLDGSDVSPELAFNAADPNKPIPYKRVQAVVDAEGDFARPNPDSAVVWSYNEIDRDGDGEIAFEETMHRTIGSVTIRDGVLYIADLSGLFHCLDAKGDKEDPGKPKVHWVYDMLAACWSTPVIVEDKVYIGDEDGEVAIFRHSADPNEAMKEVDGEMGPYYGTRSMGGSVYSTPAIAGNVLYISNPTHLFAITPDGK